MSARSHSGPVLWLRAFISVLCKNTAQRPLHSTELRAKKGFFPYPASKVRTFFSSPKTMWSEQLLEELYFSGTHTLSSAFLFFLLSFWIGYLGVNQGCSDPPLRSSPAAIEAFHPCHVCWHFQSERRKTNEPVLLLDKLQQEQVLTVWIDNSHLKTQCPCQLSTKQNCAVLAAGCKFFQSTLKWEMEINSSDLYW